MKTNGHRKRNVENQIKVAFPKGEGYHRATALPPQANQFRKPTGEHCSPLRGSNDAHKSVGREFTPAANKRLSQTSRQNNNFLVQLRCKIKRYLSAAFTCLWRVVFIIINNTITAVLYHFTISLHVHRPACADDLIGIICIVIFGEQIRFVFFAYNRIFCPDICFTLLYFCSIY